MNEEIKQKIPHSLILDNRKSLSIAGVSDVDSFDEQTVVVYTSIGELTIKGEQLHINNLNLETGDLKIDGKVGSLVYSENKSPQNKGFFTKLFK